MTLSPSQNILRHHNYFSSCGVGAGRLKIIISTIRNCIKVFHFASPQQIYQGLSQPYVTFFEVSQREVKKIEQSFFVLSEFNQFHFSVSFYIEISYFVCTSNQMTGFYMKYNARHSKTFSYFLVLGSNARIQTSRIYLFSNLYQSKMGRRRYCRVSLNSVELLVKFKYDKVE